MPPHEELGLEWPKVKAQGANMRAIYGEHQGIGWLGVCCVANMICLTFMT